MGMHHPGLARVVSSPLVGEHYSTLTIEVYV